MDQHEPTAYGLPAELWREMGWAARIRIDGYTEKAHEPAFLLRYLCERSWGHPEAMNC